MAVDESTTLWLCWYEEPVLLHVTLLAGPPVDSQVSTPDVVL